MFLWYIVPSCVTISLCNVLVLPSCYPSPRGGYKGGGGVDAAWRRLSAPGWCQGPFTLMIWFFTILHEYIYVYFFYCHVFVYMLLPCSPRRLRLSRVRIQGSGMPGAASRRLSSFRGFQDYLHTMSTYFCLVFKVMYMYVARVLLIYMYIVLGNLHVSSPFLRDGHSGLSVLKHCICRQGPLGAALVCFLVISLNLTIYTVYLLPMPFLLCHVLQVSPIDICFFHLYR